MSTPEEIALFEKLGLIRDTLMLRKHGEETQPPERTWPISS